MPTAKFAADFTDFNTAVTQADVNLRQFTGNSDKSERALRLVEGSSKSAGSSFNTFSQGLGAADKTLNAMGVHIGPEIHALDELGQAAGKTATQLGAIGTASLAAAAGIGAFKLTSLILEFTGLDKAIGGLVDSWLKLDAAQIAGAKQDSINLAISRGADATINYTEAIRFNTEWVQKHDLALQGAAKATKEHAKAAKEAADALEKERAATAAHAAELQKLQEHLFGQDEIDKAKKYIETLIDVRSMEKFNVEALNEVADAMTKAISREVEMGNAMSEDTNRMEQFRLKALELAASHGTATQQMETDEQRLARENDELTKAMKDNFVIIGQSAQEAAQKVTLSWNEAIEAARKGQGTLGGSFSSVPVGAPGSTTRYDDYGNPYGYIPGVNQPGHVSPPGGGGSTNIFNFQDAYFDTPASQQRLAERVTTALGSRASSLGR